MVLVTARHNSKHRHTNNKFKTNSVHAVRKYQWDENLPVPQLSLIPASFVVFVLAVVSFIGNYDGDFVFDDSEAIVNNKDVTPEVSILTLFSHDFWGNKLASNSSHKSYRPFTVLTFRLNYFLAGGLHPLGFHITNILLHGMVCIFVLCVLTMVLEGYHPESTSFHSSKAALICSILFATHPVHTESVSGIVGRADLLCAVCFMLSLICYIYSCHTGSSFQRLCVSMLLCAVSVLFKEQGITVIGICSAYDILIFSKMDLLHSVTYLKNLFILSNFKSKLKSPLLQRQIVLLIGGAVILTARWIVMGSAPPIFQVADNPHSFVNSTILRAINYNYLYAINAWLLVNPWWLCFDWSMGCIPVISTFTDRRVLAVLLLWCFLGYVIYYCIFGQPSRYKRLTTFALALIVVPFLPASNLFFRVGFVIAERVLYLPSLGICVLVVLGLNRVGTQGKHKTLITFFLYSLVILFTARSIQRSLEWRKEIILFNAGLKVCPENAKVHYNIGKITADSGDRERAIQAYREAVRLHPKYDQAMNNLANILKEMNQIEEAEDLLMRAVEVRSDFAAAWMNLGIVQSTLKKYSAAEESYRMALKHRRNYPDCYYNLGNLYLDSNRHTEALSAWRNATLLKPTHINSWSNMVILMDNLGMVERAIHATEEATKHLPNESQLYYNLANCLGKAGKYAASEKNFLKAISINDKVPSYHSNLGVLYHRWEKYFQAEKAYLRALELEPNNPSAKENLKMLRRKVKTQGQSKPG